MTHRGEFDLSGLKLAKFIDGIFNLPSFPGCIEFCHSDQTGLSHILPHWSKTKPHPFHPKLIKGKKVFFPRQAPEWLGDVERAAQYLTLIITKICGPSSLNLP